MNILITGINSVLGAELGKSLLAEGHKVIGLYNVNQSNIPGEIQCFQFSDAEKINFNPDIIFLIGAFVPRGKYNIPDSRFNSHNVVPIANLISQFPNARFVLASSIAVYGEAKGMLSEKSIPINPTLYGQSKIMGETLIQQTKSWAILRFSSLYGKNIEPVNFINRAINQAIEKNEILVFGDGTREQNYIHIMDAVFLLKKAGFDNQNHLFLGTSPKSVSNKEIATIIMSHMPQVNINYTGQDNSPSYHYDNSATVKMLNFNVVTTIQQGIAEILKE